MVHDHEPSSEDFPRLDLECHWRPNPDALVWVYADDSRVIKQVTSVLLCSKQALLTIA